MANKYRGEVALHAGDAEYTLRFGTNELVEIEDQLGIELTDIKPDRKWKIKELRSIVKIGFQRFHPDFNDEQVGDLIDEIGFDEVAEAIRQSFMAIFVSKKASSEPAATGGETSASPPTEQV